MEVFRTFAEGEKTRGSYTRRGARDWRTPTGLIHAATAHEPLTLCGLAIIDLHEFGRSRFPFEHFAHERRYPVCNDAADGPTG